jgi:hypothetical protein
MSKEKDPGLREHGSMILRMEREKKSGLMDRTMKDNTKRVRKTDMGCIGGQTTVASKETGKIIVSLVEGPISGMTGGHMKVSGTKTTCMVRVFILGPMAEGIRGSLSKI